jgi:hypothetical protein
MEANQRAFLNVYRHCGVISHALRAAGLNHDAHLYWMEHDPTYPVRFAQARTQWGDALRDRAHALAVDGAAEMVLHNGRPVIVEGKKLYRVNDTALIMRLLAAYDRETYGETKVIQIDLKDWDGDISKLNEASTKGILAILEAELKRQEAQEAAREAARQPVKALPAAVKEKILEQITAESEAGR